VLACTRIRSRLWRCSVCQCRCWRGRDRHTSWRRGWRWRQCRRCCICRSWLV
ncbi:uncharacterized protein L969DRAFT_87012, partial [Mixia osmundae IAM 14324]|uniref:uncharacterized protein n=1 Tax=Mixia osmundae (strain CBS 9802 / IAM 14324 / JCM 22182 / KY 12970) TaxID=764103 RepID=UPI0004A54B9C